MQNDSLDTNAVTSVSPIASASAVPEQTFGPDSLSGPSLAANSDNLLAQNAEDMLKKVGATDGEESLASSDVETYRPARRKREVRILGRRLNRELVVGLLLLLSLIGVVGATLSPFKQDTNGGVGGSGNLNVVVTGLTNSDNNPQQQIFNNSVLNLNRNILISGGHSLTATGDVLVQSTVNSSDAFMIQNAAGNNLLVADTVSGIVTINNLQVGTGGLKVNGDITSNTNAYGLSSQGLTLNGVLVCTSAGCISQGQGSTINTSNFATLAGNQTFSGINHFTSAGNTFNGDGSGLSVLNASNISGGTLSDARLSANVVLKNGNNTFTGSNTFTQQIQASGGLNASSYSVSGTPGSSLTCAPGELLQQAIIQSGIITGGMCVPGAGASIATLQQSYDASVPATVILSAASGPVSLQDAASPLGTNLFQVTNNSAATKYFAVTAGGVSITGNVNTSGVYQVSGVQISSSALSNDSNLAKLNGAQTFTGANTFSNVGNSFTGSGAGLTNLNASNVSSGTLNDARLSANVALLNGTGPQIFTGNNRFSGTVLNQNAVNSTASFTIQNAAGSSNLLIADTTNTRIAVAQASANYTLDVGGDINTSSGFRVGGTAGSSLTCSGGNVLQNQVISGGIITGGSCIANGGGVTNTLANVYAGGSSQTDETILLDATRNGVLIRDNVTPIGVTLFGVQNSTGSSKYLDVTSSGVAVAGNVNISGQYQISGVQISSSALSNDSNLAKLNGTQTFTGDNTFSSASNSFTGNGAGLTSLNATNISSGTLNDARLSANVALLNGTGPQTFTGDNKFTGTVLSQNSSNSTTAFQIQDSAGTSNLLVADTTNSKIGIGLAPSSTGATLQVSGDISSTGNIYANTGLRINNSAQNNGYISKNLTAGTGGVNASDVVIIGVDGGPLRGLQTTTARDPRVYGVAVASALSGSAFAAAVGGAFTVNVDTGAVNIGDQLVTSTTAGRATVDNNATSGIIGIAASSKGAGSNGQVSVYINPVGGQSTPKFQNTSNSATAFQVQNAAGTDNLIVANTVTDRVGIGKAPTQGTLDVNGDIYQSGSKVCDTSGNCAGVGGTGDILNNGNSFGADVTLGTNDSHNFNIETNGINQVTVAVGGAATFQNSTDSTTAFQIQDAAGTSDLFIADTSNGQIGIGKAPSLGTLDVNGTIFQSGNQVCDTSGNCVGGGGGGAIGGGGTTGTIAIFTGSGFTVGDSLLSQSGSTVTDNGNLNLTTGHTFQINGTQISSANLSNDSNLAKLNGTQTFTGDNTFSSASNSFTGNGAGLTSLDAGNISSGTLNDGRLSGNVPLKNAANVFTNTNGIQVTNANAFQVQNSAGADTMLIANTNTRTGGSSGNEIIIGNGTGGDTNTTILILDHTASAPTTNLASLSGGLFYNTATDHVNVIENGSVKELCNKTDLGCGSAGTTPTLANVYGNGANQTDETILLDGTRNGVLIRDNATPIGVTLFGVQNSTGSTKYLDITDSTVSVNDALTVSGLITANGGISVAGGQNLSFVGATGNFDQSASSGTFKTGTGNVSLNGSTTVAAGKNFNFAAGAGNFDLSASSGTFQTSSGANTLNGNTTIAGTSTFTVNGGLTSLGANLDVNNSVAFKHGTDISTTGVLDDQSIGNTSLIRLSGASAQTLDGIVNSGGNRDGQVLTIINVGSGNATIADEALGSTAANRIRTGTGANITLAVNGSITLVYDSQSSRWRVVGDVAGGSGSGVTSVGTFNSCTSYANGAQISTNTITFSCADVTNPGMVSTGAQTWAGAKTFNGLLTAAGSISVSNGQNITYGGATGNFDQSASSGTFATGTGAVSLNGDTTVASGKSFTANGTALFKNDVDSTAALQIQNAAGTALMTADTTNSQVTVQGINSNATLGSELLGGSSCSGANWSGSGNGPYTHTIGDNTDLSCTPPASVTAGTVYQVVFTVSGSITPGESVRPKVGSGQGNRVGVAVTNETQLINSGGGTTNWIFTPSFNFNGTVTIVSIKQVTQANNILGIANSDGSVGIEIRSGGSGQENTIIGLNSGRSITTGTQNVALGVQSLQNTTNGVQNTALGYQSLQSNTTGSYNTATGSQALQFNTSGIQNTANGAFALQFAVSGSDNSAFGVAALGLFSTGNGNTAIGSNSLANSSAASNNTALGYQAGGGNLTGNNNTFLGFNAGSTDFNGTGFTTPNNLQNATSIGYNSQVQLSNSLILGGQGIDAVNVGIGTTSPDNLFSISPDIYDTGTACQGANSSCNTNGTQIFGSGTTWTANMVGNDFIFGDGTKYTITGFTSATQLTVGTSTQHISSNYRIHNQAFYVTNTGSAAFRTSTNSTTAFQIQNAAGTSNLFVADTVNNRIGIGMNNPGNTLDVTGNIGVTNALILTGNSPGAGTIIKATTAGTGGVTQYDVVVKDATTDTIVDSTTARDPKVYGVAATTASASNYATVAISGSYSVNATSPAISVGDQLVVSSTSGRVYADNNATTGIVGIATGTKGVGLGLVTLDIKVVSGQSTPRFQNISNSATAFQIQNAAGSSALLVDTTTNNLVTNPSVEQAIAGNWVLKGTGVTVAQTSAQAYSGANSLQINTNGNAGDGAKQTLTTLSASTTYYISWYTRLSASTFTDEIAAYSYDGTAGSESNCTSINDQTSQTTGWRRHTCQFTTGSGGTAPTASNYITIKQTAGATRTFYIDGVNLVSSSNGNINSQFRETALQLNGLIASPVNIQNNSDSTSALSVTDSTGSNTILSVSTLSGNQGVCINCKIPSFDLDINGTGRATSKFVSPSFDSASGAVAIGDTNATAINIGKTGSNILTTVTGTALFKPSSGNDSATAFQIQNAGGTSNLFVADTINTRIAIGTNGTATGQLYISGSLPGAVLGTGTTGTQPTGVAVQGRYAYVVSTSSNNLKVFDISTPASPGLISTTSTASIGPYSVYIQGKYAYILGTSLATLQIMDISNPFAPVSVGSVATGINATTATVYVQGRYAYVINNNASTLVSVDVGNPANPLVLSSVGTGTTSRGLYVQGRYAYVSSTTSGLLQIFDISNPANIPAAVGSVSTGGGVRSIYVQGRYAYLANFGSNTLQIFDISNPASIPAVIGTLNTGASTGPIAVSVQGRYAYLVNNTSNTMQIVDVSNPASPTSIGTVSTGGSSAPAWIVVQGRYAYVANSGSNQLATFDLGGTYSQSLEAGSLETSTLGVDTNASIGGDLGVQGGLSVGQSLQVNGDIGANGAALFKNSVNSTTAFQIQNASGASLVNVDSSGSNINLLGNVSPDTSGWTTTTAINGGSNRREFASVYANGYAYVIGGWDNSLTYQNTVYYSKVNTDGTIGTWSSTTVIPALIRDAKAVYANGYIYVTGGSTSGAVQTAVYYGKVNADGTISSWTTSSNPLPLARWKHASVAVNGYIYVIGGNDGAADVGSIYYAKLNADGSTSTWTLSANPLGVNRADLTAMYANGYLYAFGGSGTTTSIYSQLNNQTGAPGTFASTGTALSQTNKTSGGFVLNGYVYLIGGFRASATVGTITTSPINSNGTLGSWTDSATTIGVNREQAGVFTANGYLYVIGGYDGTNAVSTSYYGTSTRLKVGGSLDLVGLTGENMADPGSGGNLTAGNTTIVGTLNVMDQASFKSSLSVGGEFNAGGSALFKNSSNSAAAFAIQNAAGNNYFLVNTSSASVSLGDTSIASSIQVGNTTGAVSQTVSIGNNSTGSSTSNINIGSSIAGTTAITGPTTITNRTSGSTDTFNVSNSTSTGTIARFLDGGSANPVFSLADGGAAIFRNQTDGTQGFQVQTSSAAVLLNVSTSDLAVINNGTGTPGNLLENPGVESGGGSTGSGWGFGAQYALTTNATDAHTGNREVVGTPNGASTGITAAKYYFVQPGDTIYMEGWVKTAAGTDGTGGILAEYTDKDKLNATFTLNTPTAASIGTTYTLVSQSVTVPAGKFYIRFGFSIRSSSTTGTWYFDDGFIQKSNHAEPVLFQNTVDSATAFQIQNAAGTSLVSVDTTGSTITIGGTTTTFANLTLNNAHLKSSQTTKPTIGTPTNCATSPTATVTNGSTDNAGSFIITTGTGGGQTTCDTVITFNKTFGAAPKSIVLQPTTAIGSATGLKPVQVSATSATTFTVKLTTAPAGASEVNGFYYWVVE